MNEIDTGLLERRIDELKWAARDMHIARAALRKATEACADAVVLAVDAGLSRKQAVKIAGVAPETVTKWVNCGGA